jgi:hypothetical protein
MTDLRTSLREERETIIRWDEASLDAELYTASPSMAARWRKRGIPVRVIGTANGEPHSWAATVPKRAIPPIRRLVAGALPRRKASKGAFPAHRAAQSEVTHREASQTTPR